MSEHKADYIPQLIEKLKYPRPQTSSVSSDSDLYPYGRVTADEARASGQVKHEAAVTLLLSPFNDRWMALFIKRNSYGIHGGQIALPGGKRDEGESFERTALRELQEETGVKINPKNLICRLNEIFIIPSQFVVQPFVAFTDHTPCLTPNHQEIEKAFWIDLEDILSAEILPHKVTPSGGTDLISVNAYKLNDEFIWGATAIMLEDFRKRLR
jgi:8-oxo-dGTP pyrophosphatase MutT (NUDIX family)